MASVSHCDKSPESNIWENKFVYWVITLSQDILILTFKVFLLNIDVECRTSRKVKQ